MSSTPRPFSGKDHLDPARTVIAKIGGVDAVSAVTGKSLSRVYRWMYPRDRGGTGGIIPHSDATLLLSHAQTAGIALSPTDFFRSEPATEGAAA